MQKGWIVATLTLSGLFASVLRNGVQPRDAATQVGVFVAGFYLSGHWGAMVAVETVLQPGARLLWMLLGAMQATFAAGAVWVAWRAPVSLTTKVVVLAPAGWVLREWGAALWEVTVPWLAIGYVQAPSGMLAGAFAIGGVYFASWATLTLSALLAFAVCGPNSRHRPAAFAAIGLMVLASAVARDVEWTAPSSSAHADLLQSGHSSVPDADRTPLIKTLAVHADSIMASSAQLFISSQLAIPKTPEALPHEYWSSLRAVLLAKGADAVLGMYFSSQDANAYFNGVQVIGSSGEQRRAKHHLFPFGEYRPFGHLMTPWAGGWLFPLRVDAARGSALQEPVHAAGLRVAMAICYEAAFAETVRQRAATADIIVNVASDGSHDSEQLARQFKQVAQTRALELQKPLLRTSDARGTFAIDERGQVIGELPHRHVGTLTHRVQGRAGLTPYARWGDALILSILLGSTLLVLSGVVMSAWRVQASRQERTAVLRPSSAQAMSVTTSPQARQRGQVLPLALGLLLIVAGFLYLMVNAGQTVVEKTRVTNAADAAAYSAGIVEARALNYHAYLNRAMLANQMAIAQAVSFASWIDYFARASDRFGEYATELNYHLLPNPDVVVLDVAFAGSAVIAAYFGSNVQTYADYAIDYALGLEITAHDKITDWLEDGQALAQLSLFGGIRQGQIARQVVEAMDPKLRAEVVPISHGFDSFTKNYAGDERDRFADVAMRSRDLFTRERNFTLDSYDIPLVRKGSALKKRGGTDLVGLDVWRGVDTLELHGQQFGCGKLGVSWCGDIELPIGWGAIKADLHGSDPGAGHHGNAYNENPTTADEADSDMRSPNYGYYTGIPTSQEIADVTPDREAATGITIRVYKAHGATLTAGNAANAAPSGRLALFGDQPAGGEVAALSRAQVFFDRIAARSDGKTELGSLYNPYWRVRLVAPTDADRGYAAAKQGGLVLP